MTSSTGTPPRSSGGRVAARDGVGSVAGRGIVAGALALAWFVPTAVALDRYSGSSTVVVLAVVLLDVAAVAWSVRLAGVTLAIPVGVVSMLALDWHAIPPTHDDVLPDLANLVALTAYLVTGVLLGSLAHRVGLRAHRSETARARLADEHAALRRVATMVARQGSPSAVFEFVASEAAVVLGADAVTLLRYASDDSLTVLADVRSAGTPLRPGTVVPAEGDSVASRVRRAGGGVVIDDYSRASGPLAERMQALGVRSGAGHPVVVDGAVWGVMVAASTTEGDQMAADLHERIADFTDLVGTAIANAHSRTELMASRARIVAQGDETRRKLERDLHDGVQQRLVSLALRLRMARERLPHDIGPAEPALAWVQDELGGVVEDLRQLSHGLHPAILSAGGIGPALATLARRSPVRVDTVVGDLPPLADHLEVGTYHLVAEALTNAAKHARADLVTVEVEVVNGQAVGPVLRVAIRDDGVGGASSERGSGLVGLRDRVEALGGTLQVSSPPAVGTSLVAEIPLAGAT